MIERKRLADVVKKAPPTHEIVRRTRLNGLEENTKDLVYLVGSPHTRGKLIKKGPEQSLVKWKNGNECIVVNEWIAPVSKLSKPA